MSSNSSWRRRYVDSCEAIFRELGFPLPEMLHDDALPLAMELEYRGGTFELLHSPTDMPDRVLICCKLGKIPDENFFTGTRLLLESNLDLMRAHSAFFGISLSTQFLHCMYYEKLNRWNTSTALEKMELVFNDSMNWKEQYFSNKDYSPSENMTVKNFILA